MISQKTSIVIQREDGDLIKSRKNGDGKKLLEYRFILEEEQTRFANGMNVVYKRKEVKNNSKAFGLSQVNRKGICCDAGKACFGSVIIKNFLAMLLDTQNEDT